ncbi:hypothetical protein [Streptomyces sp. NPDC008141]|uniref:hypothetical protein n=1 Tax=Streptomyces sp. NPDC008141 TaxID=3364815 RepID=UPI0036EE813A
MPFPGSVETVTVTAGEPLTMPDGSLMKGRLIFTAPDLVTIGSDDVLLGGAVEVPLRKGEFSVTLCATDATGMSPTGWTYEVTAVLTNGPNWVRYVSLPKAAPNVVLADVVVPDPVAGAFSALVSLAGVTAADVGADPAGAAAAARVAAIADAVTKYLALTGGTLTGPLTINAALVADLIYAGHVGAETFDRVRLISDRLEIGPGSGARDTNLRRSNANEWTTDDALIVALMFRHLGTTLGFYGSAAVAKPTVTGSRGGNAALDSLLSALATLGLITNSTSA